MEIGRYPHGERAADDADCIPIERTVTVRFDLTGSAVVDRDDGQGTAVAIVLISGLSYGSRGAAEAVGLDCAGDRGVRRVHVSKA